MGVAGAVVGWGEGVSPAASGGGWAQADRIKLRPTSAITNFNFHIWAILSIAFFLQFQDAQENIIVPLPQKSAGRLLRLF
jgi:hypothetical protein